MSLMTSHDLYPDFRYCTNPECPFCNPKPACSRCAELEARVNTQAIALQRVQAERDQLRSRIRYMIAAAGNPGSSEGCRLVIGIGRIALQGGGSNGK